MDLSKPMCHTLCSNMQNCRSSLTKVQRKGSQQVSSRLVLQHGRPDLGCFPELITGSPLGVCAATGGALQHLQHCSQARLVLPEPLSSVCCAARLLGITEQPHKGGVAWGRNCIANWTSIPAACRCQSPLHTVNCSSKFQISGQIAMAYNSLHHNDTSTRNWHDPQANTPERHHARCKCTVMVHVVKHYSVHADLACLLSSAAGSPCPWSLHHVQRACECAQTCAEHWPHGPAQQVWHLPLGCSPCPQGLWPWWARRPWAAQAD